MFQWHVMICSLLLLIVYLDRIGKSPSINYWPCFQQICAIVRANSTYINKHESMYRQFHSLHQILIEVTKSIAELLFFMYRINNELRKVSQKSIG